ncbi:hypothetical protein [Streptosporangium pseudovulgare]|uniref:Uncharacterized protein n=1 Tax=Streptosporangium pseudovulgare TaxID=35765 RepID=A0ABQ2QNQ6_9ACTN|nr:hypothetical protein [Streptosporangium pseudovulgare]GGP87500.1 hypothetical protein GCM10010140_16070 [Streptosporangium pseudovulgare]
MKEVILPLGIILIITVGVTVGAISCFRLHRAAMAEYRDATERTARNQEQLNAQLAELTQRVAAVEQILRSVG